MSDIRKDCPIWCTAHQVDEYKCDSSICLKHKAFLQGYEQGYRDGKKDSQPIK